MYNINTFSFYKNTDRNLKQIHDGNNKLKRKIPVMFLDVKECMTK